MEKKVVPNYSKKTNDTMILKKQTNNGLDVNGRWVQLINGWRMEEE